MCSVCGSHMTSPEAVLQTVFASRNNCVDSGKRNAILNGTEFQLQIPNARVDVYNR